MIPIDDSVRIFAFAFGLATGWGVYGGTNKNWYLSIAAFTFSTAILLELIAIKAVLISLRGIAP